MPSIFGTGPNQIPGSSDLGSMAFQDNENVVIDGGLITGSTKFANGGFYNDTEITEVRPTVNLDFVNVKALDSRLTFLRPNVDGDPALVYTGSATYYDNRTFDLVEQNLSWYSEAPRDLSYLTAVQNTTTAPDGSSTAYQVFETTDTNTHHSYRGNLLDNNQNERGRVTTFSMYAKFVSGGRQYLSVSRYYDTNNYCAARWDISAGTMVSTQQLGSGMRIVSTSITAVGNSWYRVSITVTGSPYGYAAHHRISLATDATTWTNDLYGAQSYAGSASTTGSMYWWGMQIEYSDTVGEYVRTTIRLQNTRYTPRLITAGENVPRFDHNPATGESLGLLMEYPRTNLLRNSEPDPGDGSFVVNWQALSSVVRRQVRGGLAGTIIVPNSSLSSASPWSVNIAGLLNLHTGVVDSSSANYRWSFYINPMTWTNDIRFAAVSGDGNSAFGTNILLFDNGQYVGDLSYVKYILNDGTYILWNLPNTFNTGASLRPLVYTTTAGNAWRKFWVSAFQYESTQFSTSYIKTYHRPLRRRTELLMANDREFSSWFNNEQGTIFTDSVHYGNGYSMSIVGFSDGYYYQSMRSYIGNSTSVGIEIYNLANSESNSVTLPTTNRTRIKMAWSYRVNEAFLLASNGRFSTSVVQNVPYVDKFWIGTLPWNTVTESNLLSGWIRRVSYYPVKLAEPELLEMSQT